MLWWQDYKSKFVPDLLAGLTGAVAGGPQSMGFAILAGVSPIYGLYASIVPTIIAAFACSAAFMTVAPTNTLALMASSALLAFDRASHVERLILLTLMIGVFQLVFSALRFGNLTRFVSNAVMTGFITGAGVLIILGQLSHLNGYASPVKTGVLPRFWDWLTHLGHTDVKIAVISFLALGIIYGLHHTRFKSIATLTAIIITSLLVALAGWDSVPLVGMMGTIPHQFPAPTLPDLRYMPEMLSAALAMAVLASVQSAAISNTVYQPDGSTSNTTRDFAGQGLANIAGSLFQGMPSTGSISRVAVNVNAGARTRMANVFAGLFIAIFLFGLSSLIERVPLAALAGHLVIAAISLINMDNIRLVWRVNWSGRWSMVLTFVSTLILPLDVSIYLGVLMSLSTYAYTSAANIHVVQLVPTEDNHYREEPLPKKLPPGEAVIFSVSGNLYFAAIRQLEEMLPSPKGSQRSVVILRLRDNQYLGSTGIRFLRRYNETLRAGGGKLILSGVSAHVGEELARTGALRQLGEDNIFYSNNIFFNATENALKHAQAWLDEHR